MILDDDHTDQLMYSEKGVPHVYLPDHSVNMVFLQSGTPGDWRSATSGTDRKRNARWLDHSRSASRARSPPRAKRGARSK